MKNTALCFLLLISLCPAYAYAAKPAVPLRQKQQEELLKEQNKALHALFKQHLAEARKGYTESYYPLAMDYYLGKGTPKNDKKAFRYAQKAFNAKDDRGTVLYAQFLIHGVGTQADDLKAYTVLQEWAPYRADAAYQLAKLTLAGKAPGGKTQEGLPLLTRAAEDGFSPALYDLAQLYLTADGVPEDKEKALALCQKAADQQYLPAQLKTADMYKEGIGTEPNPQQAFYYTYQAAQLHHPLAQWQVAQYFQQGYGTQQSDSLALFWAEKAARRNVNEAQKELMRLYRDGIGTRPDKEQAAYWQQRAEQREPVSYANVYFGY